MMNTQWKVIELKHGEAVMVQGMKHTTIAVSEIRIVDENGHSVCSMRNDGKGNANRIVQSVNVLPELLEALQFILSKLAPNDAPKGTQCVLYSDTLSPAESDDQTVVDYLRAAIAKAKGGV